MKVLQVNCVYGNGSTGKITADLHHGLLERGISSVVCYGRGADVAESGIYRICSEKYARIHHAISKITGIMYGSCSNSTRHLETLIERKRPDIVHLQCINGYFVNIYNLLKYLKKSHIPTILTLHAEFMYTGGCGYSLDCEKWKSVPGCGDCPIWKTETGSCFRDGTRVMWSKMKEAFDGFDNLTVVSVSPWLMNRANDSSILKDKDHMVIYNGLNTHVFYRHETSAHDKKIIFHASPSFNDDPHHIKGGYYVLELAKRMPEVNFVVAGPYSVKGTIPSNVEMLGRISDQNELAKRYSEADLTLLASKRETFSMICAESLCCGTPIVGFKAGAPEQIALEKYSEFVDYGDLDALEAAARRSLSGEKDTAISETAAARYSNAIMTERYIAAYTDRMRGNKK